MSLELKVLKDVATRLNSAQIGYMLSGSVAMNFYAQPRMTRDIDIVIVLAPKEIQKFVTVFSKGFYIEEETVKEEVSRRGMFNLIHNEHIVKVDFILRKGDEYSKTAFDRRRTIDVEGVSMRIISPEDLILSKALWVKESISEFQVRDIQNMADMTDNLEWDYIKKWSNALDLSPVLSKVRHD